MQNYNYNGGSAVASLTSAVMKRVYLKMTLGLLLTAFTALYCASTSFIHFYLTHSWLMWVLVIAEFGILFGLSGAIRKMGNAAGSALFYIFSVINGMMFSTLFLMYSPAAMVKTFFITAGTFGAMSVYGYFTDRDLSRIGSILVMALFGLIIAMVVNIFLKSSGLDWVISIVGVIIFVGLTAWDTQQVKTMAQYASPEQAGSLAIMGALNLYLDFLNLFLFLLRIFGGSRD
ncbi:MAG: Bax inhibitor-1/YccA family protein [Muribaculaceae bacterium]|nr:Bax inhibitor-1/YccA family protein [Muribaculaceae bacterium]